MIGSGCGNGAGEQARAQVPRWLATNAVPPVGRFVQVVGRVGTALAMWAVTARGKPQSRADLSRRLRVAFSHLGPTYIKLGQIISGGEGLFPEELVREFKLLRDKVPPEPFPDVRRVVELAGMVAYCDFVEQQTLSSEGRTLRPDLVVKLPGGRNIVIDAKVPFDAYIQASSAGDEETRRSLMREHAKTIRGHVSKLSAKAYWEFAAQNRAEGWNFWLSFAISPAAPKKE